MPLTQQEADYLMGLEKRFVPEDPIAFGPAPMQWSRNLIARDERERFLFDFRRGRIIIARYKQQLRHDPSEILLRFESGGRHTNPPDNPHLVGTFDGPHVHLYTEGYDDRVAFPIDVIPIRNPQDIVLTFEDICRYCRIVIPVAVQISLI